MGDGTLFWHQEYAKLKQELQLESARLDWAIANPASFTVATSRRVCGYLTKRESIDKTMAEEYEYINPNL